MVMFMSVFIDRLVPVKKRIEELLRQEERVVVAFDGRSASGKTWAAGLFAEEMSAEIIFMDDFFLPTELRTPERRAEPGGNVHYERFEDEVVKGLKSGGPFRYRVFDCTAMDYVDDAWYYEDCRLIIVEGAYSTHPRFGKYYDLAVFFHVEPEEQKKRILERNGAEKLNDFTRMWIPMEERYLAEFDIESRCDMTVGRETL